MRGRTSRYTLAACGACFLGLLLLLLWPNAATEEEGSIPMNRGAALSPDNPGSKSTAVSPSEKENSRATVDGSPRLEQQDGGGQAPPEWIPDPLQPGGMIRNPEAAWYRDLALLEVVREALPGEIEAIRSKEPSGPTVLADRDLWLLSRLAPALSGGLDAAALWGLPAAESQALLDILARADSEDREFDRLLFLSPERKGLLLRSVADNPLLYSAERAFLSLGIEEPAGGWPSVLMEDIGRIRRESLLAFCPVSREMEIVRTGIGTAMSRRGIKGYAYDGDAAEIWPDFRSLLEKKKALEEMYWSGIRSSVELHGFHLR